MRCPISIIERVIQKRDACIAHRGEENTNVVYLDEVTYARLCWEYEKMMGVNGSSGITYLLGMEISIQHSNKEVIEFGYKLKDGGQ